MWTPVDSQETASRQLERQRRSAAGPPGALCLTGAEDTVEDRVRTPVRLVRAVPALHQLPHEPDEFGRLEGLGEEGVDTDVEAALDLVLRTGADDGERQITGPGVGAQPSGGTKPVKAGHHDIKGHHIGPHLMHDIQTLGTIGRGHDLETLQLEIDPDQLPDDLVVVHNKHPARRAWHNSRVGPDRPPRPGFPDFHPYQGPRPPLTAGNTCS